MELRLWARRACLAGWGMSLVVLFEAVTRQSAPLFIVAAAIVGVTVPLYRYAGSGPAGQRGLVVASRSRMFRARSFTVTVTALTDDLDQPDVNALAASHGYALTEPWHRIPSIGGTLVQARFTRPDRHADAPDTN